MKTSTLVFICGLLLAACGAPDKKAQLESLKKQRADLETKISALEEEVSKTDSTSKEKVMEVVAKPVTEQIFKTYIEVQGRIDADENVSLSSEIPGTITKINVKVGDEVTKGQVLAETDSRPQQQQLSDLQTSYDLAKQMFEKQENLWNQKIGTEIQYLQAKSGKESLEKKIAAVQEQIRMSKIISPIDGTVDNVNIKIGQMVAPGLNAIGVINFSNLKVKADVAETYAARVKIGNEVQVLFPDIKDSVVSKVRYASRAINPTSRTFNVEVGLDNKKEYHPNMVAKLRINDFQSEKPEVVVPEKYIQKGINEQYVMVAENGKAVKKIVRVGKEYRGNAEVLSGLKAGDMIITEGYDLVNEGDKVAVKK
jgi:RND family efflux transporter MFP subunit